MKYKKIELVGNIQIFGTVGQHWDAPKYEMVEHDWFVSISRADRPEKYGIAKSHIKFFEELPEEKPAKSNKA